MFVTSRLKAITIAAALAFTGFAAHAQFEARDLDGNGSVDAYYSPTQNLSWAADANLYATLGLPANLAWYSPPSPLPPTYLPAGEVRNGTALSFVQTVSIGGVDGWRLPTQLFPAWDGDSCPPGQCPTGVGYFPSELGTLSTLLASNNPFSNVSTGVYLSDTTGARWQEGRTVLGSLTGFVSDETMLFSGHVWAVQTGDVGARAVSPVPEPETYALMLAGLGLIGVTLRRRVKPA